MGRRPASRGSYAPIFSSPARRSSPSMAFRSRDATWHVCCFYRETSHGRKAVSALESIEAGSVRGPRPRIPRAMAQGGLVLWQIHGITHTRAGRRSPDPGKLVLRGFLPGGELAPGHPAKDPRAPRPTSCSAVPRPGAPNREGVVPGTTALIRTRIEAGVEYRRHAGRAATTRSCAVSLAF